MNDDIRRILIREFIEAIIEMDFASTFDDYKRCLEYIFDTHFRDDAFIWQTVHEHFYNLYDIYLKCRQNVIYTMLPF